MAYPILAPNSTWYKSTASRATIAKISIVSNYTPTGSENETWNADKDNSGSIKCYRIGTEIIMSANGAGKIKANADSSYMFSTPKPSSGSPLPRFTALTEFIGADLLDTSEVTTFQSAFSYCEALKTLNLASWDVGKVENFQAMFQNNTKIGGLDFSKWKAKPKVMSAMFNMNSAINETIEELDLSTFDFSELTAIQQLCYQCANVKKIIFPKRGSSKCSNLQAMIITNRSLEEIDLGGMKPTSNANMLNAFAGNTSLKTIYASRNWHTTGSCSNMFAQCSNLVGGDGTRKEDTTPTIRGDDGKYVDYANYIDYARIDSGERSPGYFTLPDKGSVVVDYRELWEIAESLRDSKGDGGIYSISEMTAVLKNYPVLAPQQTWYKSTTSIDTITQLNVVESYAPTGSESESWNADVANSGSIKCYRTGTILTMSAEGKKIRLNVNSEGVFANMIKLESISGLEYIDASGADTLEKAFYNDQSLVEVDISTWNLHKVIHTDYMFDICSSLKNVYLGEYLRSLGKSMFMRCTSLEKVTGLGRVTTIGDLAFYYTPKLFNTDFTVSLIESIGDNAFRVSSIEDGQDFSYIPLDKVGKYATRLKRWTKDQLNTIRSTAYSGYGYKYIEVPYPDSQNNYPKEPWSYEYRDNRDRYTVANIGCMALSLYHIWQVLHKGTVPEGWSKTPESWIEWWVGLGQQTMENYESNLVNEIGVLGTFANNNSWAKNNNGIGGLISDTLGWKQIYSTNIENIEPLGRILNAIDEGTHMPLIGINSSSGSSLHALTIIGYDSDVNGRPKLAFIDSDVDGHPNGCIMWVGYEDMFVSIGDDGDRAWLFDNA